MARRLRGAQRDGAMVLAARFAEYTGWITQELGDDHRAIWWTNLAVDLAEAGGDPEMAAYALVRQALVALYRHDAATTVRLARAAQERTRDARVLGLAAQREAQGHALAGEYGDCMRAMDRAGKALQVASRRDDTGPVIGTSQVSDPVATATGWCLFDLGQPERSADILRHELDRIPHHAFRARARYGGRLALALAAAGDPEQACAVLDPVLDTYEAIGSATLRTDLVDLNRELNRWHRLDAIRGTRLRLLAALQLGQLP
jgi:tetratricopeptide (TPR) repeat protein